ncbi:unnamed protein product [Rotaria socialis]|uniref:Uncharacterized protein n=2 Tax=Rotaria socialis TaxID=392032 RepID=A0A820ZEK7_9BILA|nr:unnamed protein product [Rotaria socialis]
MKRKSLVEPNENDLKDHAYIKIRQTMKNASVNNEGYRHLNCILDGMIHDCIAPFKYVFKKLHSDGFSMDDKRCSHDGNFSWAEKQILETSFKLLMKEGINEIMHELRSEWGHHSNVKQTIPAKAMSTMNHSG